MKKTPKQLAAALYEAVQDKNEEDTKKIIFNFVKLLKKENKLGWQEKIIAAFLSYAREKEGVAELEVTVAREIPEKIIDKFARLFWAKKSFVKEVRKNPAILGGLIMRQNDKIWDLSIKKQLFSLKKQLYG